MAENEDIARRPARVRKGRESIRRIPREESEERFESPKGVMPIGFQLPEC